MGFMYNYFLSINMKHPVCVLQCTVYCHIAEQFKSDDEVKISDQTKDVDATEKVHICLENQTNFYREFLASYTRNGSILYGKVLVSIANFRGGL